MQAPKRRWSATMSKEKGPDQLPGIGLAEWIAALRLELERAAIEGKDKDFRFLVGPITLDIEVASSLEGGINGGVKFWVLTIGASAQSGTSRTQRMQITLTPSDREGRSLKIADKLTITPA